MHANSLLQRFLGAFVGVILISGCAQSRSITEERLGKRIPPRESKKLKKEQKDRIMGDDVKIYGSPPEQDYVKLTGNNPMLWYARDQGIYKHGNNLTVYLKWQEDLTLGELLGMYLSKIPSRHKARRIYLISLHRDEKKVKGTTAILTTGDRQQRASGALPEVEALKWGVHSEDVVEFTLEAF